MEIKRNIDIKNIPHLKIHHNKKLLYIIHINYKNKQYI